MADKIIGVSIPLSSLKSEFSYNRSNGSLRDGLFFLSWLHKNKLNAWQMLPIHQTQYEANSTMHVNSPYKGYGYGINSNYLSKRDLETDKSKVLEFQEKNSFWLDDYLLFCALTNYFHTDDWRLWREDIRHPNLEVKKIWIKKLASQIDVLLMEQYLLHEEYKKMKNLARQLNVNLFGDMQFYLPFKSPTVWSNQHLFQIDDDLQINNVSGIPNKKYAIYGRQVWGHPLYNWEHSINTDIYKLFSHRLKYLSLLFDYIRIDHASGFFKYGSININDENKDCIKNGPGNIALTNIYETAVNNNIKIYAEDAGYELDDLRKTMAELKIPGVRVLRCAYDETNKIFVKDHADILSYQNNVLFTSTHDTETLFAFIQKLDPHEKQNLALKLKVEYSNDDFKFAQNLRRAAINSRAQAILIPLQDWLLTTERINTPGTERTHSDLNWNYRMKQNIEDLPDVNL